MHAYVINLVRSPERRVKIAAQLQKTGIGYEFVDGVEGADLELADPRVVDPSVRETDWFRPGIAGCAFSHLRVYQKIIADNLDWALVLEDDVKLPGDFDRLVEAAAGHMDAAEVVLLNFLSPDVCKMSRRGLIRLPSSRQLVFPVNVNDPGSSAAYLITRDACKRMIEAVVPFQARPDNWGHFFDRGALDRVRCVMPLSVHQDPIFPSTIDYHDQAGLKARVLNAGQRYNLKLMNQVLAYRRARIWRGLMRVELVDEPFVVKPSRLD
jgi:glycosyl transferase, family 25